MTDLLCCKCGSNDEVIEVVATHYTNKITEPMCFLCRGGAISAATMEDAPKFTPEPKLSAIGLLKEIDIYLDSFPETAPHRPRVQVFHRQIKELLKESE